MPRPGPGALRPPRTSHRLPETRGTGLQGSHARSPVTATSESQRAPSSSSPWVPATPPCPCLRVGRLTVRWSVQTGRPRAGFLRKDQASDYALAGLRGPGRRAVGFCVDRRPSFAQRGPRPSARGKADIVKSHYHMGLFMSFKAPTPARCHSPGQGEPGRERPPRVTTRPLPQRGVVTRPRALGSAAHRAAGAPTKARLRTRRDCWPQLRPLR